MLLHVSAKHPNKSAKGVEFRPRGGYLDYALNDSSVCYFPEGSKKEDMCAFLNRVREANGLRTVVMAPDNSVIHRCREVTEHAAKLNVILVFLPPYCPQYNPIELIWKSVRGCPYSTKTKYSWIN